MKYLMVDNGRVFYSLDGSAASKKPIDQISKDDLLTLLKLAVSEESFEMDPYSTESVHNAAHQIIYKNIYQKFEDIRLHRVSIYNLIFFVTKSLPSLYTDSVGFSPRISKISLIAI